jgi:hypothetical protein
MSDDALIYCVKGLSAVFIFGGDIKRADDPSELGGLGYRSLRGVEADKTGPMPSHERVLAGAALHRINPKLVLIPSGGESNLPGAPKNAPRIAKVMAADFGPRVYRQRRSLKRMSHSILRNNLSIARPSLASVVGISGK